MKVQSQSLLWSLLLCETCRKSLRSLSISKISIGLWMQQSYLPIGKLIFPWSERFSLLSKLKMSHSFKTQSVLLKKTLPVVTLFQEEICKDSHNSKSLVSALPLESHLTSVYKSRRLYSASFSSQSWWNRHKLWACTLMCLITLITYCKTLLSSSDSFQITSISLWMIQCVDSCSKASALSYVVRPESCPVIAATPSGHKPTQNDQLILNSSVAVVLVGKNSAHNKSSYRSSRKIYHTKMSKIASLTSVESSMWIAYHADSLIFSYNCASTSSAISSILSLVYINIYKWNWKFKR